MQSKKIKLVMPMKAFEDASISWLTTATIENRIFEALQTECDYRLSTLIKNGFQTVSTLFDKFCRNLIIDIERKYSFSIRFLPLFSFQPLLQEMNFFSENSRNYASIS